jgi:hypothetical protein
MSNKIPTAEQLFKEYQNDDGTIALRAFETAYKRGCSLHVEAALKAAQEQSKLKRSSDVSGKRWNGVSKVWKFTSFDIMWGTGQGDGVANFEATVDEKSILNAYSKDKII